jgi:hypothetical protein
VQRWVVRRSKHVHMKSKSSSPKLPPPLLLPPLAASTVRLLLKEAASVAARRGTRPVPAAMATLDLSGAALLNVLRGAELKQGWAAQTKLLGIEGRPGELLTTPEKLFRTQITVMCSVIWPWAPWQGPLQHVLLTATYSQALPSSAVLALLPSVIALDVHQPDPISLLTFGLRRLPLCSWGANPTVIAARSARADHS